MFAHNLAPWRVKFKNSFAVFAADGVILDLSGEEGNLVLAIDLITKLNEQLGYVSSGIVETLDHCISSWSRSIHWGGSKPF
ncbi:hypothetical protein F7U82_09590 [Vibrio parahaemolyticus]|nr:hypothetical protein [Vibrio parahaemolyticus]